MTVFKGLLTAAAVICSAVPGAPQTPYSYPQPQPAYGHPIYGYSETRLGAIIGQLLGSRYNEADLTAVRQCASAAMQQAAVQYWAQPYGNSYGHNLRGHIHQGFDTSALMSVTAITNVRRRENGLHVSGLIDSRFGYPEYLAAGDFSFGCNVDYGGIVSNLRVHRANSYRS